MIKEARGSDAYLNSYRQAKNTQPFYENNNEIGARIGEAISFAIQAYVEYQQHRPDSDVNESIRYAFEGGIVLQ